jgi:VWFA-related protein
MMLVRSALLVLGLTLAGSSPAARTPAPQTPARPSGTIQSQTTAVLVDVVVRDKRGQPVMDLTPADFEIVEDGVVQELGALTLHSPKGSVPLQAREAAAPPAAAPAGAPAPAPLPAAEPPSEPVIALAFDRLSPEARTIAHKAALGYIGQLTQAPSLIGVFGVDLALATYQNYTRDTALLRKAIDAVGSRSTAKAESQAARAREAGQRAAAGAAALGTLAAGGQAAAQAAQGGAGAGAPEAIAAEMERRTIETFEVLEREQQGLSAVNALLALVNGMRGRPGRKSLVLFSEGFGTAGNAGLRFRSLVDTANRANVTIYAMDAAGLRTQSTSDETRDTINAAVDRVLRRNPTADVTGTAMTQELERAGEMVRNDPHVVLGQLTDETGGLMIRNTNDLGAGFKRVDQDMRNYYMLSYVPKNENFDGRFRTISVNVKRPGVEVAARKGYFAVRAAGPLPVMPYEARALALLDSTPVPNAFPIRAAALKFPEEKRPGLTPVLVSVPGSAITFATTEDRASYRAEFTVLVRVRNQTDEVIDKMSQNYVLTGPIDKLESAKQGNVLFYRERELDAGLYKMEAIVHDAVSEKASVRFSTIERPVVDPKTLRASNLVIVANAERVADKDRPAGSPFLVGDLLLYPNLGDPLRKSATPEIGFFFTIYPTKSPKPQANVELLQNGTRLATLPLALGDPDGSGRIQQVSRLPTGALSPGTYELRVVVSQGQQQVSQSTLVRLTD